MEYLVSSICWLREIIHPRKNGEVQKGVREKVEPLDAYFSSLEFRKPI